MADLLPKNLSDSERKAFIAGLEQGRKIQKLLFQEMKLAKVEAESLAKFLWKKYYSEASPDFELCDSIPGILSQIDNMCTGLTLKKDPVGYVVHRSEGPVCSAFSMAAVFSSIQEAKNYSVRCSYSDRSLISPVIPGNY